MEISVEKISEVRRKVNIIISADQVARVWKKTLRKVGAQARIPGFRPGKAPARLLERRYASVIRDDVLEALLGPAIAEAVQEGSFEAVGQPELNEIGELRGDHPLTAVFSVDVLPEIDVHMPEGDTLVVDKVVADEDDLRQALDALRDEHAEWREVELGAEDGDRVELKMSIKAKKAEGEEDSEAPELETKEILLGSKASELWLKELLLGMKAGDALPTEMELAEDSGHPLAGQAVELAGQVTGVQRRFLPESDEELAKASGFDDVEAFLLHERTALDKRAARREEGLRHRAALAWLLEQHPVVAPTALVESEIDRRMNQFFGGVDLSGNLDLSAQLKSLRDELRPAAAQAVSEGLMMRHLVEREETEVAAEEIDARIEELIAEMPDYADRLRESYATEEGRDVLKNQIIEARVFEKVLATVTLSEGRILAMRDPDEVPEEEEAPEAEVAEAEVTEPVSATDEADDEVVEAVESSDV